MKPPVDTVSIIGAGAMGAAYASILHTMDPRCVTLIAGGERFERLSREGLIVNGKHYPVPVVKPEDPRPPADLIIVAVKHHQLDKAVRDLKNSVGEQTIAISVMNGIESEEQIGDAYGMDRVLYAVAVGIDAVKEGNAVTYTKQGRIFFGERENGVITGRVRRVQELFDRAGIVYETPPDMIRILWWKFMINVGINQASAALRAAYSVFQESREAQDLMESAMREVMALAAKAGIRLTEEDIQNWYAVLAGLSPGGKTSMLQDVEAGRKTEVEMFAGKMIELGRRYNVPTPVNQQLFETIRQIEASYLSKTG
ncbi:MAG TPA: ketopantoate reductase family protein [Syntrophorhabdaceae bacterium]|nr:ketopantoate reductase family protein [Syntrophorhabdaceae bacterium]HNT68833.1 ketopantoate reductase family protein [Syntrophorhabdaceae bacterium]